MSKKQLSGEDIVEIISNKTKKALSGKEVEDFSYEEKLLFNDKNQTKKKITLEIIFC